MIAIDIKVQNFERVRGKLRGFPKAVNESIRISLKDYFFQDFRPMLGRVIKGFRAANVPAQNSPRYADYKARRWGVSHSLGILTGRMHSDAMNVEPEIRTSLNKTQLRASFDQVPRGGFPYLPVVHEGLDGLHKSYPFVEGTRMMTHKHMMRRVMAGLSQAWKRSS